MTHLDEGTLLALRDGEMVPAGQRRHADGCPVCSEALREARERSDSIRDVLLTLTDEIDSEAARAAVRARLDAQTGRARPGVGGKRHLRRAAAILLVTAGAVYAVPRSPISGWFSEDATLEQGTPDGPEGQQLPERGGVEIEVSDGIEVVLEGVTPGTEVEVAWLDGSVARISAGGGSSYSFAEGRIESSVSGGPVLIEAPRTARVISISINGRMVFSGPAGSAALSDVVEQSAERLVFSVPRL